MSRSIGLALVVALAAGCIVGPTAHWVPTGKVRRDKRTGQTHNFTGQALAVDLDRRVFAIRVGTKLVELCEHDVEVVEHTNMLALAADLTLGAAAATGGFWYQGHCEGGTCKNVFGGIGHAGYLYAAAALVVWGAQSKSSAWDHDKPDACPGLPAPPYDGDITVVLPESKIHATALGAAEPGTHTVEIPFHDAADAVFETSLGRLRVADLFTQIREVTNHLSPELETTLSLRDADGDHVLEAGEHLAVDVVVRNRGSAAAWVRPRLAASGGHVEVDPTPPARRIAPHRTESFELGATAAADLADGALAIDVSIDAAAASAAAPLHERIATARHREPRPVLVGIEITDGGPAYNKISTGNNNHAIDRGEFVVLRLVFQNQGDAATRGELSVELTSGNPEVTVPTAVHAIPALKPGELVSATYTMSVSPRFSQGIDADPRIPVTFSVSSSIQGSLASGAVPLVLGEPPPPPRIKVQRDGR